MANLFFHKYAVDAQGNPLNSVICKTSASRTKKMISAELRQELEGVVDSGSPVLDRDTKEPTGLNWAEFVG